MYFVWLYNTPGIVLNFPMKVEEKIYICNYRLLPILVKCNHIVHKNSYTRLIFT